MQSILYQKLVIKMSGDGDVYKKQFFKLRCAMEQIGVWIKQKNGGFKKKLEGKRREEKKEKPDFWTNQSVELTEACLRRWGT